MNISRLSIFRDVPVSVVYDAAESTIGFLSLARIPSTAICPADSRDTVVSVACQSSIDQTPRAVDVLAVIPATGRPVQFVRVPDDGVPSTGVVKLGDVIVCTPVNVFAASVLATVKLASGNIIVRGAVGQEKVSIWLIIGTIVFASGSVQVRDAVAVLVKKLVNVLATFRRPNIPARKVLIPVENV
jgi:hypothetical protein